MFEVEQFYLSNPLRDAGLDQDLRPIANSVNPQKTQKLELVKAEATSPMEITTYTVPDAFLAFGKGISLRYDRIVGLWHKDYGTLGKRVGYNSNLRSERQLNLPNIMGQRLLQCMNILETDDIVNCHYFGQLLVGMEASHAPPFLVSEGQATHNSLDLGEIGIIGSPESYPDHTLVGLGNDNPGESIQVMSGHAELGIAKNALVLDFYKRLKPNTEKAIYRAAYSSLGR